MLLRVRGPRCPVGDKNQNQNLAGIARIFTLGGQIAGASPPHIGEAAGRVSVHASCMLAAFGPMDSNWECSLLMAYIQSHR